MPSNRRDLEIAACAICGGSTNARYACVARKMIGRTKVLMLVAKTYATDRRPRREGKSLVDNGFDVEVVCWDRSGRRPSVEIIDNCVVHNVKFGKASELPYSARALHYFMVAFLFQVTIVFWAIRLVKMTRLLVIHAHDFNTLLGSAIARIVFKERVRLVYDCHELTPGIYRQWYGPVISGVIGRLELAVIGRVDAVITVNEAIHRYLRKTGNRPMVVVYTCPSIREVASANDPLGAKRKLGLSACFVVLFPGEARQDYDFSMILDAARELSGDRLNIKFVFTGRHEMVLSLVMKGPNEIEQMFDFRGWVADNELFTYYMASDLCFAVTRDLGPNTDVLTPIKIFESMACGVPVIVRDGTLAAKIVERWQCGVVVRTRSKLSLELKRLSQNRSLLRSLGEAGRTAFYLEYNWGLMETRLLQLYARIQAKAPDKR